MYASNCFRDNPRFIASTSAGRVNLTLYRFIVVSGLCRSTVRSPRARRHLVSVPLTPFGTPTTTHSYGFTANSQPRPPLLTIGRRCWSEGGSLICEPEVSLSPSMKAMTRSELDKPALRQDAHRGRGSSSLEAAHLDLEVPFEISLSAIARVFQHAPSVQCLGLKSLLRCCPAGAANNSCQSTQVAPQRRYHRTRLPCRANAC